MLAAILFIHIVLRLLDMKIILLTFINDISKQTSTQ